MTVDSKSRDQTQQTVSMLEKHHGDGNEFAKLMEETFEGRFNEEFWKLWDRQILPGLPAEPLIVDLGTGPGTFIKTLASKYKNARVAGIECAPYMLSAVGELPVNAEIIEADLQQPHLPFDNNSIDAAITSVVVHEMIQPVRMFREVHRILKPSAKFYIYDWVRAPLQSYLKSSELNPFSDSMSQEDLENLFTHFIEHNRFSLDDLVFMLTSTGFDIVESGYRNEKQHAWILATKPD